MKKLVNFYFIIVLLLVGSVYLVRPNSSFASMNAIKPNVTCLKLFRSLINTFKISKFRAAYSKIPEIQYFGEENVYASLLRLNLFFHSKGMTNQEVLLSKLVGIHPINATRELPYTKMLARKEILLKYFKENGVPSVLDFDFLNKTIPSKSPFKAITSNKGNYIIVDGNGRLVALQKALEEFNSLAGSNIDPKIIIKSFIIDYKRVENLVNKRRMFYYPWRNSETKVKEWLTLSNETAEDVKKLIAEVNTSIADKYIHPRERNRLGEVLRYLQNVLIWRERGLTDVFRVGLNEKNIEWMLQKKAPLGFLGPLQWDQAKKELIKALEQDGILDDATAYIGGTSTTFYSHNPTKRVGHHFDSSFFIKSDYDIKLHSKKASEVIKREGLVWKKHEEVAKNRWLRRFFPNVAAYEKKWEKILGRKYSVILNHSESHVNSERMDGFYIVGPAL